jgi:hypothetical protein
VAELLIALNEFNKYELFTGTGEGVQPLVSEGNGTSNITFNTTQSDATSLSGKFVYFDNATGLWKAAYAVANPSGNEYHTAQAFAISTSSTGLQVTTSGKLIIPFQLTDINDNPVVAGSYYYLTQNQANAGKIQQNAPTSGIMQVVCQVMAVDASSTTLLLLNDLNQVADDILVTTGDGSKYLGDDGQYHPMLIAGLAGRTANCIDSYELMDIKFNNIAAGRTTEQSYTFPNLSANGTWLNETGEAAIAIGYTSGGVHNEQEANSNYITRSADWGPGTGYSEIDVKWQMPQPLYFESFYSQNNSAAGNVNSNWKSFEVAYSDNGTDWTMTGYTITNPSNAASAFNTHEVPTATYKSWGPHKFWAAKNMINFSDNTNICFRLVQPTGEYFTVTDTTSLGYVKSGDITIEDNIASNFSKTNYLVSKYIIQNWYQYIFRIRQSFNQVQTIEPIVCFPNQNNYLYIENGTLKLTLNGTIYHGNLTYDVDTFYHFRVTYSQSTGYTFSSSTNGSSWTNEIILSESTNYVNGLSMYLGVVASDTEFLATSGKIDLANTGFEFINNDEQFWNYPLSNITDTSISTIILSFKGTGLIAAGRAADSATVLAATEAVDTVENTIIAGDEDTIFWDKDKGIITANYTEVDYLRQYEDLEENTVLYAKDTNQCYEYIIIYPNFIEANVIFNKEDKDFNVNVTQTGGTLNGSVFTGASGANLTLPEVAPIKTADTWEFKTKYTYNAGGTNPTIIGYSNGVNFKAPSLITVSNNLKVYLSSALGVGGSWDLQNSIATSLNMVAGTTYYIKFGYDGTKYYVDYNTDGSDIYTNAYSFESSIKAYCSVPFMLMNLSLNQATYYSAGQMDLANTSITINGKTWWTGITTLYNQGDDVLDFSNNNASFTPNKFLNRNGFNFGLKLDLKGNLKISRKLDARNYGSTADHPFYYAVQGVDWATFTSDGGYTQGIKIGNIYGSLQTGTAQGTLYQQTVINNDYTDLSYGGVQDPIPGTEYIAFEKPIRFSSVALRNYSSGEYFPQYIAMHVSNDLQNWYSILSSNMAGYTENGMLNNVPVDVYANWPNVTAQQFFDIPVVMPNEDDYYKYVRLTVYRTNYRALVCSFFVGMINNNTTPSLNFQTAEELILEKENFINNEGSGLNAQICRRKVGTSYQVQFLDRQGYVSIDPSQAVIDKEGKQLLPNNTVIYAEPRLLTPIATQRLAYQVHCKQYLLNDRSYGLNYAGNPFMNDAVGLAYFGCATTGTVANSWQCLMSENTAYDFANATNVTNYVISFLEKVRVGYFYFQNHTTANYSPQWIKIYGAVNGGSVEGTISPSTSEVGNPLPAAIWEEVPITLVKNAFNNGDFDTYAPMGEQLTFSAAANDTNNMVGTPGTGLYGGYNVYIAPKKAYQQYRVEMQRPLSNRILMTQIIPKDVQIDPFATNLDEFGVNLPIMANETYYPSSSATTLPDKATLTQSIFTSPNSPTGIFQLYNQDNNALWDPSVACKYAQIQQAYQYPVSMGVFSIRHGNDLNYATNVLQYYGTNLTEKATVALSNTNSLYDWIRLDNTKTKYGTATSVPIATKINTLYLGNKEYGYSYFTALVARTINNRVLMDGFGPRTLSVRDYLDRKSSDGFSYYTQEWKWTNVAGEEGDIRDARVYDHPSLDTYQNSGLTPAYRLSKRDDENNYWTPTQGEASGYLPDGTAVYRNTSMVGSKTVAYENRWMYKFTDSIGETYYSNATPDSTGKFVPVGSYMYKNVIPVLNKDVYSGIPLTATANTGSANGFTYICSGQYDAARTAWVAFQNLNYDAETWIAPNNSYSGGVPVGDPAWCGFISPEPLTLQGYTIGGRVSGGATPWQWRFEGSNNGTDWVVLDERNTKVNGGTDNNIANQYGTTYYFNNQDAYTQYRWVILKSGNAELAFTRLKVWGVFVLEENPFKAPAIYQLTRTNVGGTVEYAYTHTQGESGEYIPNDGTVYTDLKQTQPITNVWAYEVSDGTHNYWTKVPGDLNAYVPETTMIYEDFDFITEFEAALVDTWQYTGVVNKKFSYTGEELHDFIWDEQEPYNKYIYTGDIDNRYKYTGKIEGWTFTGVKEDIYDTVPNFRLTLNRDDVRQAQKQTMLGMAYPVTSSDAPNEASLYSFTTSGTPGQIVPAGTPLYSTINDTTPAVSADGTNTYIWSTAAIQTRYSYEYIYTRDNNYQPGTSLDSNQEAWYDTELTEPVDNTSVDLTQFTYTAVRTASKIHDFYHPISEEVPIQNYNLGLVFDGSQYTFTCYPDGGDVGVETLVSGELIKSSFTNPTGNQNINNVDLVMRQQNFLNLNLTKSLYSWWEWNNLIDKSSNQQTVNVFRLAKIDGGKSNINDIFELFPWRVDGTGGSSSIYTLDVSSQSPIRNVPGLYIANGVDSVNSDIGKRLSSRNNVIALNTPGAIMSSRLNPNGSGLSVTLPNGGTILCYNSVNLTITEGSTGTYWTFNNFTGVLPLPAGWSASANSTIWWSA